jgi:type IV pilus assembly protein PilB
MPPGELERIGELLVEEGGVTHEELVRALAEGSFRGSALAQVLESCGHVKRAELAAFLASRFRLPLLDDLRKIDLSAEAARLVPEEVARKHEAIPLARIGDVLCVAKSNYYNRAAVQELRKVSGLKIKVVQADEGQVRAAIEAVYRGKKGELPAPAARRKETGVLRSSSTARIPISAQSAPAEAVPLISMPENGSAREATSDNKPVLTEYKRAGDDLNEVIEVLDAIQIPSQEFAAAMRDPLARLVLDFEDVFQQGRPVAPLKVS